VAAMLLGATDTDANFSAVRITASITTDATEEQFAQLKSETERRCPIYQLFSRSGLTLTSDWVRTGA
jgi:putative redox protein